MFELFKDDGCGNHHWGDGDVVGYKIQKNHPSFDPAYWEVKKKKKYSCQHEGCNEYKYEYVNIQTYYCIEVGDMEDALCGLVTDD